MKFVSFLLKGQPKFGVSDGKNITDLTGQIKGAQTLKELGIQNKSVSMRVKQLWSWIFTQSKINFEEMTNLSKEFRFFLKENYSLERPKILSKKVSVDGTRKYLSLIHI